MQSQIGGNANLVPGSKLGAVSVGGPGPGAIDVSSNQGFPGKMDNRSRAIYE